ncbi:MAG: hypothetical protein J6W64_10840 [Bacilli bacterium]|nr:hypothetical protein [Bacilli bacterium]
MDKKDLFEPNIIPDGNNDQNMGNGTPNLHELKSLEEIPEKKTIEPETNTEGNKFLFNDMNDNIPEPKVEEPVNNEPVNDTYNMDTNINDVNTNDNYMPTETVTDEKKNGGKKGKLAAFISAVIVALAGFGVNYYFDYRKENGTIVCSGELDGVNEEITFTIKYGHFSSGTLKESLDLKALANAYGVSIDDIDTSAIKICDTMTGSGKITFRNCKEGVKGNILEAEADISYDITEKLNVNNEIKGFEKEGLTCKRK